jgi:hypothetical protein
VTQLMHANTRTVYIRHRDEDPAHEELYSYLPGATAIQASLQPTGYTDSRRQELPRLWGEYPEKALVMYCADETALTAGQGVCVDVGSDASCDYRITGVEVWPGHRRIYLAFIPESRRAGCGTAVPLRIRGLGTESPNR